MTSVDKFVDNVSKVINMIDDIVHHKTLNVSIDQIKKTIIKKYGISASFFGEINNMTVDVPKVILNISKETKTDLVYNQISQKEYLTNIMNIPENVANYMIYGLMDIDDVYSYMMDIDIGYNRGSTSNNISIPFHAHNKYLIQNNSIEMILLDKILLDRYNNSHNIHGSHNVEILYKIGNNFADHFNGGNYDDIKNMEKYMYEYKLKDSEIDVMNKKVRIYVTKYELVPFKDNNISNWKYQKTNIVENMDIPLIDNGVFKCDIGLISIKKVIYDTIEPVDKKQYKPTNPTKQNYKLIKLNDTGEIIEELEFKSHSRTVKDLVLEHSIDL